MHDEWSGLAILLAEIIEKHASELDFDDMPLPRKENDEKIHTKDNEKVA